MESGLEGRLVEFLELQRPYRSTRQVLEVTSALDPGLEISARDQAPIGQPVDLIWAESAAAQAEAVAHDVDALLRQQSRQLQDIAILVTRKWLMGRIKATLADRGIPAQVAYPKYASDLSLSDPSVKIMTVHSAKGYEFDVVFLVGLENLPDPDGTPESVQQSRSGYVGTTRARDQLILTYTKNNVYLERLRSMPKDTLNAWNWPDDYPEA
jgi:superfamily I DNA/RNA helicase